MEFGHAGLGLGEFLVLAVIPLVSLLVTAFAAYVVIRVAVSHGIRDARRRDEGSANGS